MSLDAAIKSSWFALFPPDIMTLFSTPLNLSLGFPPSQVQQSHDGKVRGARLALKVKLGAGALLDVWDFRF